MLVIAFLENHVSVSNPSTSATLLIGSLPPLLFNTIGLSELRMLVTNVGLHIMCTDD